MEGSHSEEIFESLNLNPQLFINEVVNSVDDLLDGAFHHFHQEASIQLKIEEGTDKAEDLTKGVATIRNMIKSALDKRLVAWEKYCLHFCFAVPEGFSLPDANGSSADDSMDVDTGADSDLDAKMDSLRAKLTSVEQESSELKRELQALQRQSTLNHHAGSVNEALQLYEQYGLQEMFQELVRMRSEYLTEVEKLKMRKGDGKTQGALVERLRVQNGDLFTPNFKNGLSNATAEDLEAFITRMNI